MTPSNTHPLPLYPSLQRFGVVNALLQTYPLQFCTSNLVIALTHERKFSIFGPTDSRILPLVKPVQESASYCWQTSFDSRLGLGGAQRIRRNAVHSSWSTWGGQHSAQRGLEHICFKKEREMAGLQRKANYWRLLKYCMRHRDLLKMELFKSLQEKLMANVLANTEAKQVR